VLCRRSFGNLCNFFVFTVTPFSLRDPTLYNFFIPGLCFIASCSPFHPFVCSPPVVVGPSKPFPTLALLSTRPRRHLPGSLSYNIKLDNSRLTLHAYPFAAFAAPFLAPPTTYRHLPPPSLLHSLAPPSAFVYYSSTHPSLTLCICYMILHHPAIPGLSRRLSSRSQTAQNPPVASFVVSDELMRSIHQGTSTSLLVWASSVSSIIFGSIYLLDPVLHR